jgi:hypothetical protein
MTRPYPGVSVNCGSTGVRVGGDLEVIVGFGSAFVGIGEFGWSSFASGATFGALGGTCGGCPGKF